PSQARPRRDRPADFTAAGAAAGGHPVDSAAVRRRNLGLVLRHIAAHGPCARTDIAIATGLAPGSVTALLADLPERGLVAAAVRRAETGSAAGASGSDGGAGADAPRAAAEGGPGSVLVRVVIAMAGPVRDDAAQTVLVAADFGWLGPVRLGELVGERLDG